MRLAAVRDAMERTFGALILRLGLHHAQRFFEDPSRKRRPFRGGAQGDQGPAGQA